MCLSCFFCIIKFGIAVGLPIKFLFVTLPHMSIRAGVIGTVTFQQVDHAPHAKASAEGNHEGLQSVDGRSEKLHILLLFSGLYPAMKKAAPCRAAASTPRDNLSQGFIQKRLDRRDRHS